MFLSQIHEKNGDWNILTKSKSFENTLYKAKIKRVAFHVIEILPEKYKII